MADLIAPAHPDPLAHRAVAETSTTTSAEDVLQTTWLALVRSGGSITDPQAVLQWLIVAARREAWRVAKVVRRADVTEIEPDDRRGAGRARPRGRRCVRDPATSRLWQHIAPAVRTLPALLRVIAFADRPDYAAVAEALGMPVGSIGPTRGRCLGQAAPAIWPPTRTGSSDDILSTTIPGRARRRRLDEPDVGRAGPAGRRCTPPLDPVPAGLVDRLEFGITLDALHAEIAALLAAVGRPGRRALGHRHGPDSQTVTFTSTNLTTMVTITPLSARTGSASTAGSRPGAGVQVEIAHRGGARTAVADANGRFVFDDVPVAGRSSCSARPANCNRQCDAVDRAPTHHRLTDGERPRAAPQGRRRYDAHNQGRPGTLPVRLLDRCLAAVRSSRPRTPSGGWSRRRGSPARWSSPSSARATAAPRRWTPRANTSTALDDAGAAGAHPHAAGRARRTRRAPRDALAHFDAAVAEIAHADAAATGS